MVICFYCEKKMQIIYESAFKIVYGCKNCRDFVGTYDKINKSSGSEMFSNAYNHYVSCETKKTLPGFTSKG